MTLLTCLEDTCERKHIHTDVINKAHFQQCSMFCVLKPRAIKHSLSFFLGRLSNEPVFEVPFCVCELSGIYVFLPTFSASAYVFLFHAPVYLCVVCIMCLFALVHSVLGF